MKTKKIIIILCSMFLIAALFAGCNPFALGQRISQTLGGSDGPTSVIVADSEYDEDYDYDYDDYDVEDYDDYEISVDEDYDDEDYDYEDYDYDVYDDDDDIYDEDDSEVQRVGSTEHGYVDVPADYLHYVDTYVNNNDLLQYADPKGTNIVTLSYFDENNYDAETLAYTLLEQFETDTYVEPDSVDSAMVELDGNEAYQIYGYYPDDDIFLVVWILDSPDDDYIHYVAVEFSSDNYDLFELVEDTYHVLY